ncbi:BON domain-containing protein [Mucilaginibacter rubeus]|uniref:BON domain-containing protein n=1 Tax=Mucilaginibacter rubeus TaxID=2027860 RepID=A0AAE6MHI5_9SPHI|nr:MULTISPECIES: BON domain-containing protein [Mucilaginibacter]QEM03591.1 BON domain-containing protein [Mucilaginibacter rubeus]QEM16202.1 BON domain-containing protein [Mucilaginibacter gossypii]QTE41041.1 BON domain-containing protein [Mucilaginibacter rubeus]QTE47644.1 BON domain-containing protein [Mucilaginibacter rubeus]QTE59036.1 BON domain-containing protein [Mucilaginibacter rubeus]
MKTDSQIQKDVMDELKWQPFLNSSAIGVAVKNGIVTLSGTVDTFSKKITAERAAKKVIGVKAIAEDIQIGVSPVYRKTDTEIAEAVLNALKWHSAVPDDKIKIKVEDGAVTMEGELEWEYQRVSAKTAIQDLTGVRSVINLITLRPRISPAELEQKISAAFQRSANIDATKVHAGISGNTVTLTGRVRSFAESEDAADVAWAAPGVFHVVNNLDIEEPELAF